MSVTNHAVGGVRATRREWLGLAILALPTLLLSVDVSVLYLALPQLSVELGADSTEQLWILDIYGFLLAGFLVTMGNLGDRVGRRRLLLIGGGAFGVTSLIAAYSTSPEMLIAARALLGVAGATLMPSTMALIKNMFRNPQQMGVAISVWMSCFMGGMTVGPLVGGVLLENYWWGSVFLLGVPIMLLLLVAGPVLLPEYRKASAGQLDLISVALSLAAILAVIYGLKELARSGWDPTLGLITATGFGVGTLFVRRQRALADPLLDLTLFRARTVSTALAVMLFTGVVMAGVALLSTIYLQVVAGLSPLAAGLWLIPQNIAMVAGMTVAPILNRRWSTYVVMTVGLIVATCGLLMLTQVDGGGGRGTLVTGLVVACFGVGMPMVLTMSLIMSAVPADRAGSAASVSETAGEFGVALGVATLGTLGAALYRTRLSDAPLPGVPAEVTATAGEGIGVAKALAGELPPETGEALFAAARAAFAVGLNGVAMTGVVMLAVLTVVTGTVSAAPRAWAAGAHR
ncbi:MFS transporter [Plantactinospora sp. GCM10030261]|uniref:MFS transporter n=1 Tax=Plantactinospora sp. GCM10030261 TaxID=3273420 RepID=UPI0036242586